MKKQAEKITVEVYDEDRRWYSFNRKREYKDVWVVEYNNTYLKFDNNTATSFIFWTTALPVLLKDNVLLNDFNKFDKYLFALKEEECNKFIKLIDDQKENFLKLPLYKLKTRCDKFKIFKKNIYYKFDKGVFTIFTNYQSTDYKIETKSQGLAFIEYENCVLKQEWVDVEK